MKIEIPYTEFDFEFSRSSGAGGQNVNKVNTKVTLRWNIKLSKSCHEQVKARFLKKYHRFTLQDGEMIQINSQRYRSQQQNITDCISKLHQYLEDVRVPPRKRISTKPTKNSVKKRLDSKDKKSKLKKMRSEKF